MPFYADLHIHSKYSRATSRDLDFEHLFWWARRKGITVVATGDFTHPAWWDEIRTRLVPAEPGLWRLRPEIEAEIEKTLPPVCRGPVRFLLEVEISTIYKKGDRTRKVHHLLYAAHLETAGRIRERLARIGNIASDGRPILGLDSRDLLEITLEAGDDAFFIPAHIWTPWFAALGSKSGFDSIEECYGDLAGHIFAVETGLSSDPPMNWRISHLDRFTLVSSSDAHSPPMLGREASAFSTDLDYFALRRALETGNGYGGTVEFFPEEGKYHLDGHRGCGVCLEPGQTRALGGLCPDCGKPLTVGVLHRVEVLADRPEGGPAPAGAAPFRSLVPLPEILSELRGVGPRSKGVEAAVAGLVRRLGPELAILDELPLEEVGSQGGDPLLTEALGRLRAGRVHRRGGFDGEYGVIRLFEPGELAARTQVPVLFAMGPPEAPPAARSHQEARPRQAPPPPQTSLPPPPRPPSPPSSRLPVLAGLDPDQRAAAEHGEGPLLLIAGPGTGKTRTLTHRLAWLVGERGVPPEHCLAVTFTRRAAAEMAERLEALLPGVAGGITVTTFHALGLAILREHHRDLGLDRSFRVIDEVEAVELARELFGLGEGEARRRLGEISHRRRDLAAGEPGAGEDAGLWEETLRARDLVDFDGLLRGPVTLLGERGDLAAAWQRRYRWISVDEYQDIDPLQHRLLGLLAPPGANLCAIGDPDQSIYRFRGADVTCFLRFRDDHPGARILHLTGNYRSSPTIVRAALGAVAPASLVPDRQLHAVGGQPPEPITLAIAPTEGAEAEYVVATLESLLGGTSTFSLDSGRATGHEDRELSFGDIAILYRAGAQVRALEEALARSGIPCQRRSHLALREHPGVGFLVETLRREGLREGDTVTAGLGARGVEGSAEGHRRSEGEVAEAIELLLPLAEPFGADLDGFLATLTLGSEIDAWDPRAERISLMTLHAAKGLEWPVVFLVGCEEGLLPLYWGEEPGEEELAEERRLFFVGLTRAKSRLILTGAARRRVHGELRERRPSRFLADLPEELCERAEGEGSRPGRPRGRQQLSLF